jgi:antirestriction protein ArdC
MTPEDVKRRTEGATAQLLAAFDTGKSAAMRNYFRFMATFRNYSMGNQILIYTQMPTATLVKGFKGWNQYGRYVRKGEKGLMILAPLIGKPKTRESESDEAAESQVFGFRAAFVFDVSQTDGQPLPDAGIQEAKGDPGEYADRLRQFAAARNITLKEVGADELGTAQGSSSGGTIKLKSDLEKAASFAVLVHEVAHEILHQGEARRERKTTRNQRELEAESVAFIVCTPVGLDHSGASDYIKMYDGTKEGLHASLQFIQQTAHTILKGIEDDLAGEEEGYDKESPHQRRGSQKLTVESGTPETTSGLALTPSASKDIE